MKNKLDGVEEILLMGPLAGKIWRIGLMGHTARKENVNRALTALKEVLNK